MEKLYSLHIRGKTKEWLFEIEADPKDAEDWLSDGLIVYEITNKIPEWYFRMGFPVKLWVFFQDILNFNNPFTK